MSITVVDGNNLADVMKDAGIEEPLKVEEAKTDPKDKPADKVEAVIEPDDVEDDDGITPRQRKEMTANMLKAIGKKHRRIKEAEEFAAHQVEEKTAAEDRAEDLTRRLREAEAKIPAAKEVVEPKRADFATDDEYIEARSDWKADQRLAVKEQERLQEERQASMRSQFQKASDLVADFKETVAKEIPEYTLPSMQTVVGYMRESDLFAELGYHFAKNPAIVAKLAGMSPVRQLVELGKIEARLSPFGSSESSPKDGDKPNGKATASPSTTDTGFSPSKARSDAPVIKPLTSGEGIQVDADPSAMNTRQAIEHYQKTKKVNFNARKRH